jgi:hypothetical protein
MAKSFLHDYKVVNGPGMLDLAHALFRGSTLKFTVQKKFGDLSGECWVCSLDMVNVGNDDLRENEIFKIAGEVVSSGANFLNQKCLEGGVTYTFPHYDAKTRTCDDAIVITHID